MYIFISHSSQDKPFVRLLAESLSFHNVPFFLDERHIQVGDNIKESIYEALARASQVIYVLSTYSIKSEWVKEELSVAKMRQVAKSGCQILPVLIDDVTLPIDVAHIKYADFRQWQLKQPYFEALGGLLRALKVKTTYIANPELRFFHQHLAELSILTATSNMLVQVFFELEGLWFSLFNREAHLARNWVYKILVKNWNQDAFNTAYRKLEVGLGGISFNSSPLGKVIENCKMIEDDVSFWTNGTHSTMDTDAVYQRIWAAEDHARTLSALVFSVILDLQGHIGSVGPE